MNCTSFIYSNHALKRMLEKAISTKKIEETVLHGEIIREYRDDNPFPSKLMLRFVAGKPLHVVVAQNFDTQDCIIITCYEPNTLIWQNDFKSKI